MLLGEQKSILTIGLFSALADGSKGDAEREEIRRMALSLADGADQADLTRLVQDVLLKRVQLSSATSVLTDSSRRQLAYEMAVCVCDADGRQTDAERRFLADLKQQLHLNTEQTEAFDQQANEIVELAEIAVPITAMTTPTPSSVSEAELDQGHIKEFIAAVGVGLGSQYLEQFGRKLLGGLLGKVAGKTIGKIGGAATRMAFSFATTYALGQVAKRYYAGGRSMNTAVLRDTFQNLLSPAKQMQAQYLPQIQQKAASLDSVQLMKMLRGSP